MSQDNRNIYKTARASTGLSQEAAAEVLGLSVETIRAYETGQRVPPDQTVVVMARRYMTPWLTLEHARATDELGLIPKGARPRPFSLAAIQFYNLIVDIVEQHHGRQMLRIAEDGVIDAAEIPILAAIDSTMESLFSVWLSIRCCEGAKKERPEGGASKRSAFQEKPRTTVTGIISQSPRNASTICAGEAVNAL